MEMMEMGRGGTLKAASQGAKTPKNTDLFMGCPAREFQ
jgi:hypothetical protein